MKTFQCFNSFNELHTSETFQPYSIYVPFNRTHNMDPFKMFAHPVYSKYFIGNRISFSYDFHSEACIERAFVHTKQTLLSASLLNQSCATIFELQTSHSKPKT